MARTRALLRSEDHETGANEAPNCTSAGGDRSHTVAGHRNLTLLPARRLAPLARRSIPASACRKIASSRQLPTKGHSRKRLRGRNTPPACAALTTLSGAPGRCCKLDYSNHRPLPIDNEAPQAQRRGQSHIANRQRRMALDATALRLRASAARVSPSPPLRHGPNRFSRLHRKHGASAGHGQNHRHSRRPIVPLPAR